MLKNVSVIILGSENVHGQEWTLGAMQGGELRSGRILLYQATQRERAPGLREPGATDFKWFLHLIPLRNVSVIQTRRLGLRLQVSPQLLGRVIALCFPALQWVVTGVYPVWTIRQLGVMKPCCCNEAPCWRRRARRRWGSSVSRPRGVLHGSSRCRMGRMVYRRLFVSWINVGATSLLLLCNLG